MTYFIFPKKGRTLLDTSFFDWYFSLHGSLQRVLLVRQPA